MRSLGLIQSINKDKALCEAVHIISAYMERCLLEKSDETQMLAAYVTTKISSLRSPSTFHWFSESRALEVLMAMMTFIKPQSQEVLFWWEIVQ